MDLQKYNIGESWGEDFQKKGDPKREKNLKRRDHIHSDAENASKGMVVLFEGHFQ